ncbi:collagen alpha-2(IV) chain-like [Canis lupus familiaris]|uniref:collagen alpha-2(IV) chain-like n=1 Tax=Canis lupus dingo TaxID=286419 RepID=UPI000DC6A641|nr:collagen alpha-2(IV) chain-like [Canis lupus dingo]XP_038324846.1 collagen alpha-2(IV) chain-like [Canis lupus familiaris]XP_038388166.1 collagen alpha-2(IV) chain-like [Canis lupus familiaris]XP_038516655.1 collagen alpha-2(IV) chain-like [Canis lupus familiaris]
MFIGFALPCAALVHWLLLHLPYGLSSQLALRSPARQPPNPRPPGALGYPEEPEPGSGSALLAGMGEVGGGRLGSGEETRGWRWGEHHPGPPGSDLPGAHGAKRCPRAGRAPFARGVSHTQHAARRPRVENLPAGTSQIPGTLSSPAFGFRAMPDAGGSESPRAPRRA